MLSRRELIAGGAAVPLTAGDAGAAQRDREIDAMSAELRTVRDVLTSMQTQTIVATPSVTQIRERQRTFLRIHQRYPDCIDVGFGVWERMQDWHIAHQRPLTIAHGSDGRWQMDFIMTVLVLRPELQENEIGQAYDR